MTFMRAFITGVRRANSALRLVLLLYAVNLLLAVPIALGFRATVAAAFGRSTGPESLIQEFDYTVVQDFMDHHGSEIAPLFRQLVGFAFVSMLLSTFLAGGTLSLLREQNGGFSAEAFFRDCGKYFARFFRLFLIFGILLILLTVILSAGLGAALSQMADNADSEVGTFAAFLGAGLAFVLPAMLLMMAADYAKIITVTHDARSMAGAARDAFRFILSNFFPAVGLQLALLALALLLIAAYWGIEGLLGMTSPLSIAVVFLIQQIFMVSRMWTRVTFFSGEMMLYRERKPQPVRFAGWDDSPLITPA
jgi:hypothetical protein